MKHFEIGCSAHFSLQEELISNIAAGRSGDMVSFIADCCFFSGLFLFFVCGFLSFFLCFKRSLLQMFIHLQLCIAQMHCSFLSLQQVPLAAVFGQQCIIKEQLSLMQLKLNFGATECFFRRCNAVRVDGT